jgi:hypothetical protein
LGCVEYPDLIAEAALGRATSTDNLTDLLQAEENLMIRTFGPPWVEHPVIFSESSLDGPQLPGAGNVPKRGAATHRALQHRGTGLRGSKFQTMLYARSQSLASAGTEPVFTRRWLFDVSRSSIRLVTPNHDK